MTLQVSTMKAIEMEGVYSARTVKLIGIRAITLQGSTLTRIIASGGLYFKSHVEIRLNGMKWSKLEF